MAASRSGNWRRGLRRAVLESTRAGALNRPHAHARMAAGDSRSTSARPLSHARQNAQRAVTSMRRTSRTSLRGDGPLGLETRLTEPSSQGVAHGLSGCAPSGQSAKPRKANTWGDMLNYGATLPMWFRFNERMHLRNSIRQTAPDTFRTAPPYRKFASEPRRRFKRPHQQDLPPVAPPGLGAKSRSGWANHIEPTSGTGRCL